MEPHASPSNKGPASVGKEILTLAFSDPHYPNAGELESNYRRVGPQPQEEEEDPTSVEDDKSLNAVEALDLRQPEASIQTMKLMATLKKILHGYSMLSSLV